MVKRDKEGHYTMIKGSNHQDHPTNVGIYALKTQVLKYLRLILTSQRRNRQYNRSFRQKN